jgi:hypothetical protein
VARAHHGARPHLRGPRATKTLNSMGGDYNDMHTCSHFHRRSIMNNTVMIAGGYGSRRAAMKQIIAASEAAMRRWFHSVQRETYSGQ